MTFGARQAAGRATADGASVIVWLPMIVFEIAVSVWLLAKGRPESR